MKFIQHKQKNIFLLFLFSFVLPVHSVETQLWPFVFFNNQKIQKNKN